MTPEEEYGEELGIALATLNIERGITLEGQALEDFMQAMCLLRGLGLTADRMGLVIDQLVLSWNEAGVPLQLTGPTQFLPL